jgi:hypothetical protein
MQNYQKEIQGGGDNENNWEKKDIVTCRPIARERLGKQARNK